MKIWAGENFSYETERILCEATPAELLMEEEKRPFGSLACVIVKNPHAEETRIYLTKHPKDEDFTGKGSDDQGNHSPAVYRETLYR